MGRSRLDPGSDPTRPRIFLTEPGVGYRLNEEECSSLPAGAEAIRTWTLPSHLQCLAPRRTVTDGQETLWTGEYPFSGMVIRTPGDGPPEGLKPEILHQEQRFCGAA